MLPRTHIAVEPTSRPTMQDALTEAVSDAGGHIVAVEEASALVFADPEAADEFPAIIARCPHLEWVQLPYAGIEPFADHLDFNRVWTCGKGVYSPPVAEWIMAALLTAFREMPRFVRARSWESRVGRNLLGAKLTIVGGGGIAHSFLDLIEPWQCEVTVVRRQAEPIPRTKRTVSPDLLDEAIRNADAVILAAPLTNETEGIIDAEALATMRRDAWLLNVARGRLVVTEDLVTALRTGSIGGAVLDVTDPEPLPDGHPLWELDNCVITPHVGNTVEMGLPLIADRVRRNVERWIAGEELLGVVDVSAGY